MPLDAQVQPVEGPHEVEGWAHQLHLRPDLLRLQCHGGGLVVAPGGRMHPALNDGEPGVGVRVRKASDEFVRGGQVARADDRRGGIADHATNLLRVTGGRPVAGGYAPRARLHHRRQPPVHLCHAFLSTLGLEVSQQELSDQRVGSPGAPSVAAS